MEVSKLIQNMREQGIGIWTEGGKIRYLKKDGKLDDDIKNILIRDKGVIMKKYSKIASPHIPAVSMYSNHLKMF